MDVDYRRIGEILDAYRGMDPHEAYYLKDSARYERFAPLAPTTADVLRSAFSVSGHVLDVGCGRGRTLLDNVHLFDSGVGLDESEEHMIAHALREREARGIHNVEFCVGKAVDLPFDEGTFDFVFSERGPLGHSDQTLKEALRVLKTAGLIFVETGSGATGDAFATLQTEKARFERHGVAIQLLSSCTEELRFPDYYEFMKLQGSVWFYLEQDLPSVANKELIDNILRDATRANGCICLRCDRIWIGGSKMP